MNVNFALRTAVFATLAAGPLTAQTNVPAAATLVPTSLLATADPELEVTVWATSPMLKNPTNLDIDKDGRVWVAVDFGG